MFRTQLAEAIFHQKYAHEDCETWPALARTLAFDVCGQFLPKDEVEAIAKLIEEMKFIPGGRYLYYAGRPIKAFNNCGAGSTLLLTREGMRRFDSFTEGESTEVYSPVANTFLPATMHEHGEQELFEITFAPLRGKSAKRWKVQFTADHRWPTLNRGAVTDLKVGDRVAFANVQLTANQDAFIHGLVFADGSVSNPRLRSHYGHQLRLCGGKRFYLHEIETAGHSWTYPDFAGGDPVAYVKSPIDLKQLPTTDDPAYVASFIRGWVSLDGHDGITRQLHSVDRAALEFFVEHAHLAGFIVTGDIRVMIGSTNYAPNGRKPLYLVNFKLASEAPPIKVESIIPIGKQKVYCPFEPIHNRIVIDYGIDTFQCYLLKCEEDTREEWAEVTWRAKNCLMTGGGIGIDYSILRPAGSTLRRTGGTASGPVSLMRLINEVGREVMQGGSRRSAIYASLDRNHADVHEFLHAKDWHTMVIPGTNVTLKDAKAADFNWPAPLDMTNISVNYSDGLTADDPVFLENVVQALRTGEPGFSFNFGDKAKETLRNACVPYETRVLTRTGYHQIGDLVGYKVEVWNGKEWAPVVPFETGQQPLLRVHLSDGTYLDCTPNHRFVITSTPHGRAYDSRDNYLVEADDLIPGMKLAKFDMPVITEGDFYSVDAYSQGFYSGDGTEALTHSWVYEPKYPCMDRLHGTFGNENSYNGVVRTPWRHGPMMSKDFVPINGHIDYCLNWLAGLFDADGTVTRDDNGNGLQLASINVPFLQDVRLMLTRLGVRAKIVSANPAGVRLMPDGRGGKKEYLCQETKRLLIGNSDTYNLMNLGLKFNRLDVHSSPPQRDARRFATVTSVEDLGIEVDTYCFTEPKSGLGTFEGIVTGQCTEVTSEDDSDVCNLGSLNLSRFGRRDDFEWAVDLATKFLLCGTMVADLPYEKVYKVREKNRRLGLGLMGVHEWLLTRGYNYRVVPELHEWLYVYQVRSDFTAWRAADAFGISRPVAVRAIAPTGTIGIIAGTTTGIEPLYAVAYQRRYLKNGTNWHHQMVIDGTAKVLIEQQGVDPDSIESAIDLASDPERRIEFQADVQDYVDQSISSTINLPAWGSDLNNEDTVKPFAETLAHYAPRLRGFTAYPDGARGGQPLTSVPYRDAVDWEGVEFEDNDSCKGGVCGL